MTFAVPELLKTMLEDSCKVTMEPLDVKFSDNLIIHIHVVNEDFDIDILLLGDGEIRAEVWPPGPIVMPLTMPGDPSSYAQPITHEMFNLNDRSFIEKLSQFLHKHIKNSEIKIRYQKRNDTNTKTSKTP
jgi:hypothetical protein